MFSIIVWLIGSIEIQMRFRIQAFPDQKYENISDETKLKIFGSKFKFVHH